ncbi:MAG: aminotransferase class V-fold PLP-dependent enzyme, partial [Gemmataceae bacterium]
AAGIAWVKGQGREKIPAHEMGPARRLWEGLDRLGFTVLGHRDVSRRVATVSFTSDKETAPNLGMILDTSFEIAIRPGFHCAPYIHVAQGTREGSEGAVRVSPGPFNTEADIDALLDALSQVTS